MTSVPLASTGLRPKDIDAAMSVLASGRYTMGSVVQQFESKMAEYLGSKQFVMVNSGSSANLIAIEALLRPAKGEPRLMPGDKVLVPAIAWPTTVWPLIQLGLKPIFVDVDLGTLGLSPNDVARALETERNVKAVFLINPLGRKVDSQDLISILQAHPSRPLLLSDTCEALGSRDQFGHAGAQSLLSTFSFYFSHHITTMEGGGVATNDIALAEDLRSIRAHGWSRGRSDEAEWLAGVHKTDSKFLFVTSGYNVRPMEIQAAIGLSQLEDVGHFIQRRREIAQHISENLEGALALSMLGHDLEDERANSWMLMPFRVKDGGSGARKTALDHLAFKGIETRPVLTGNFSRQPSIQRFMPELNPDNFPVADLISEEMFLIGCHHDFTDDQVEYISSVLLETDKLIAKEFLTGNS